MRMCPHRHAPGIAALLLLAACQRSGAPEGGAPAAGGSGPSTETPVAGAVDAVDGVVRAAPPAASAIPSSTAAPTADSAPSAGPDPGVPRRYGIEAATITFALRGAEEGTETLVFDRWGLREARRRKVTRSAGRTVTGEVLIVRDGDVTSTIDLSARTGTRIRNDATLAAAAPPGVDPVARDQEARQGAGQKPEELAPELATVAGKACKVWKAAGGGPRLWVWSGLELKTELGMGDFKTVVEATAVKEGPVPASSFAIPEGIEVGEVREAKEVLNLFNRKK